MNISIWLLLILPLLFGGSGFDSIVCVYKYGNDNDILLFLETEDLLENTVYIFLCFQML